MLGKRFRISSTARNSKNGHSLLQSHGGLARTFSSSPLLYRATPQVHSQGQSQSQGQRQGQGQREVRPSNKWRSTVLPYGAEFSLIGKSFQESRDLYVHSLQHEDSNLVLHHMVNPRLAHQFEFRPISPRTLLTSRPNINSRSRDESKWKILSQLLQMVNDRFGHLTQSTRVAKETATPRFGSSAAHLQGAIYEHDLWHHIASEPVPSLDAVLWRKCLQDMNQVVFSRVYAVQYWIREQLSTHEVLIDELDVIRELMSTPDHFLQKKIESMYRELLPKYGGHIAVSASSDYIHELKEQMADWISRRDNPVFQTMKPQLRSLPKSSQNVEVIEYPSFNPGGDYEFVSILYQLPSTSPEIHNAVIFYIQDKLLNYKSPLQENLTRILGIHPQSQNERMYDPLSRVLEFTFPIANDRKVPANEIANMITASLKLMISNEKLLNTFIQETIASLELEAMKNSNHFNQWCQYVEYRQMNPLATSSHLDFDLVMKDPFFNKQHIISLLKDNGKEIVSKAIMEMLDFRSTMIYRPSEQWKNRVERSLRRILKDDPSKTIHISNSFLKQKENDVLRIDHIDPGFHKNAFSLPSELVELSPSLSVYFDYTSRGDLVDVSLLSIPRLSPLLYEAPLGFHSFMCDWIGFLGSQSSKNEDFYKETIRWTSGLSSHPFIYLNPIQTRNGMDIGAIPSLMLQTTCAEKTFHIAIDQMARIITQSPLLRPESLNPELVRDAGKDFCSKLVGDLFPPSIELCKKQVLANSLWGYIMQQLKGFSAIVHVQGTIQKAPAPSSKVTPEMQAAQEALLLNMKSFASHFLIHPAKRIFLITTDLKNRDSLLDELKGLQQTLSTQVNETESKEIDEKKNIVLQQVCEQIKTRRKEHVFVEYPGQGPSSDHYVSTVSFDVSNILNTSHYAHGLIFSELLLSVMREHFDNDESNYLFESVDIEYHWSGAILVSAITPQESDLSYFFELVGKSIDWMLDESNIDAMEKLTDKYDVYLRGCRRLEASREEFERTYRLFNLVGAYEPQDVKDCLLSQVPLEDTIRIMRRYIPRNDSLKKLENARILVYGQKKPLLIDQNQDKWLVTKIH